MKVPDEKVFAKAYFAAYFDVNGNIVQVYGPNGPAKGRADTEPLSGNAKKVEAKIINPGEEQDPECIWINGVKYCL